MLIHAGNGSPGFFLPAQTWAAVKVLTELPCQFSDTGDFVFAGKIDGSFRSILLIPNNQREQRIFALAEQLERHVGLDTVLLEKRTIVYEAAKNRCPERWSGATRSRRT